MRTYKHICILALCALSFVPKAKALTVEQEQQFTYYWYAARQALYEERYDQAYLLLEFCHMLNPSDGQTLQFLGIMMNSIGQYDKAKMLYKQAFEAAPRDQWQRYTNFLLANETEETDKEALAVLEKAYNIQSAARKQGKGEVDEELLNYLRKSYVINKQWKKALSMQDEMDRIKGYNAQSADFRYRVYLQSGKTKQALKEINRYLENDPTDVRFLLAKAFIQEELHYKKEKVAATYEKVLSIDAYNLIALNSYAYYIATHGGDLKKAEQMSEITIRQEPNNPAYLDTYGWILHLQGHNELARFYLDRALRFCDEKEKEVREVIIYHMSKLKE